MAEFLKPPDMSFPAELLQESGGHDPWSRDSPTLEALGFLAEVHKRVWKW